MWNVLECAVQGRGHLKTNTPCQDKTYSIINNNVRVISLADGAGSAKMSHFGAERITKFICYKMVESFDNYYNNNNGAEVKTQIVSDILTVLKDTAIELGCEIRDLASTLLFVAVKDDKYIVCHIGDGVIGYLKNNELKVASYPNNGEFVNTTIFTTSKEALVTMNLMKGILGSIEGFVLMSDGTENSLYDKREKQLAVLLKDIMKKTSLIAPDVMKRNITETFEKLIKSKTQDDCSIAILVQSIDNFEGYLKLNDKIKCNLLKINNNTRKYIKRRYDNILIYLENGKTIEQLSKMIHLRPKYTKRIIDKLYNLNLLEKNNNYYRTLIIL